MHASWQSMDQVHYQDRQDHLHRQGRRDDQGQIDGGS